MRFSPIAWAKLLFLRDLGETEVGAFGISAAEDLLHLEDIVLVRQKTTSVSVRFNDTAVADFFDEQVDRGLAPERFGRVWVHTHPGNDPTPSLIDEETFARVFARTDWTVMFILARGGQSYARLEFQVGPGGHLLLPVEVDYARPFPATDQAAWQKQYAACVERECPSEHLVEPSFIDAATLRPWERLFLDDPDDGLAVPQFPFEDGGFAHDDDFFS